MLYLKKSQRCLLHRYPHNSILFFDGLFIFEYSYFQYNDIYNFPQMAFDAALKAEEVSGESESEKEDEEEVEREMEMEPELERELQRPAEDADEFVEADTDMDTDEVYSILL